MNPPSITEVPTPQSRCRFALAHADITPPPGIYHRMWGAAKHDRATGVHRPIRATVAVFEPITPESSSLQIIVALDHCVLGSVELRRFLAHVAGATGQAPDSILVVFSHTHGAGLMGLDRAPLPGGDLIPPYLDSLAATTARLVTDALASLAPVTIAYAHGRCALAAHRDFWDAQLGAFVCGFNPAGPADDTVLIARVTDARGQLVATVVNYACHPTTLAWDNTLISPDYVGALREVVERETGSPCLFLQGACGELGPREGFVGDTAVADRNGRELAYAALSAITALPPPGNTFRYAGPVVSGATLGTWRHEPVPPDTLSAQANWQHVRWHEPLPYRTDQPTPEAVAAELQRFEDDERTARAAGDVTRAAELRAMAERRRRLLHRLAQLPPGDAYPLEVVAWRIGDAIWLGVQGESYSLLQTGLRSRFPGTPIVVASLAADWGASYLPPRDTYGKGIYQENIAVVRAGSLEQLIDAIAARIHELKSPNHS